MLMQMGKSELEARKHRSTTTKSAMASEPLSSIASLMTEPIAYSLLAVQHANGMDARAAAGRGQLDQT